MDGEKTPNWHDLPLIRGFAGGAKTNRAADQIHSLA